MKRPFYFLLFIIMTNNLFAQTENYKIAINNFKENFNTEKYNEIFNSFDSEMQKALPIDKTNQFLIGLKSQVGNIENIEFIKYEKGTYASFKTKFESAILNINLSLNKLNQINGLYIKPYEEEIKTENKTINVLNSFPKEIAENIYSKSKKFPNNTQLSIAIIRNGKTNYYGIIKVNDSIKAFENQNRIFEIGSLTKVFTSTVLSSLVVDNKIELTDNVNSFYPFDFKDNAKINFESLANHTSGLPRLPENLDLSNETNPYKKYGDKELEDYLKNLLKLDNSNSKKYLYSNLGAGILGNTLGLSQKTSFQNLLQKRIFDKYKMENSFMSSQNLGSKLVKGLNENGEIISNWDFDSLFGGGGILSCTEDLAKFASAQLNHKNKELSLTRTPTFTINDKMKIGLGWHILKSGNNKELIWHNGGTGGYSSSMSINIKEKTAVIILSNVSAFNTEMKNIDELCFALIKQTEE
jgi:CubicO group peptidase (beta-lactamase class C family)